MKTSPLPYRELMLRGTPAEAPQGGIYVVLDLLDWWEDRHWDWGIGVSRHKGYNKFYARRTENGTTIWLHKWVCERAYGPAPEGMSIADHLDGESRNCRRGNFRWANDEMNTFNKFGFHAQQACMLAPPKPLIVGQLVLL